MIEIRDLSHRLGDVDVLTGLGLTVAEGETVALVGPSGCGKSTLLELIAGLREQSGGEISVGGERSPDDRSRRCAWMPQSDQLLPWKRSVDNAAIALRLAGADRSSARERSAAMLARLGLARFGDAYPHELSGGMRQRVAFARTLLAGTPVLLLDEPLASLDAITRADLQGWLAETLAAERRTTVLVTHDVEEAMFLGDRVAILSPRPGSVVWTIASPAAAGRGLSRPAVLSEPGFVAAREQALEILSGSMGASP